jgi:DoxX-like protein
MFSHLYLLVTILVAVAVAFSAVMKIRRHPHAVRKIHGDVGVPLHYFPFAAALQLAGALGLILGIRWPLVGIVAGVGLIVYFVTAMLAHIRAHDFQGIRAAVLMFFAVAIALTMRLHLGPHPHWYRF